MDNMTPQDHLTQAERYLARAEKNVWKHPGKGRDELPYVGSDVELARHVEVYTKLAGMHMMMFSAKSAFMPQPEPAVDEEAEFDSIAKLLVSSLAATGSAKILTPYDGDSAEIERLMEIAHAWCEDNLPEARLNIRVTRIAPTDGSGPSSILEIHDYPTYHGGPPYSDDNPVPGR